MIEFKKTYTIEEVLEQLMYAKNEMRKIYTEGFFDDFPDEVKDIVNRTNIAVTNVLTKHWWIR